MPPSVRYYNQTAPFWDFVADLEGQGFSHPAFGQTRGLQEDRDHDAEQSGSPWVNGLTAGWPFGGFPHRGRRHDPSRHEDHEHSHGGIPPPPHDNPEAGSPEPRGPPPPFEDDPHHGPGHRGGPSPPSGPHHGPGCHGGPPTPPLPPHYPGSHHGPGPHNRGRCGGRGGWGGRHRGGPRGFSMGGPPFLNNLAEMFQSQLFGDEATATKDKREDFNPEVDVFDTETSFIVHVSLPGAKKEDVGVNWDAEKSELNIAGVIYRPGDEELLKTLALDERKVGAFERKVRLGSRANPAQVDIDGISAKMEDGVLRVEVPKLDSGYVEIKKVDIE